MLLNFLIDELKKERKILSFQIKSYNEDLTRTRKRKQKNKKKS